MMDFEEETERWRPIAPEQRGRHSTFSSAVNAALTDLLTEKNDFFDSLCDNWARLYPDSPARPGKYADGKIFLFVKNVAASYVVRPKLRKIAARLAELPGAPKRIDLRLEIHAT